MHRRQRIRSYPKSRLDRHGTGFNWRMRVPDDVFKLYRRRYFIVTLLDTSHSQAQKEPAKLDAQHLELIDKLRKVPANERTALVAGGGAKPLAKQVDAAEEGERRWLVSDVNPEQEGNVACFGDLIDQWNRKGANVALHFPIPPEVNVRAIPRTRLWASQK